MGWDGMEKKLFFFFFSLLGPAKLRRASIFLPGGISTATIRANACMKDIFIPSQEGWDFTFIHSFIHSSFSSPNAVHGKTP